MSDIENQVAEHYTKPGQLDSITSNLQDTAEDPDNISLSDLKPYDNMHIGGTRATQYLLDSLSIAPGMTVLDIGSGRGGPARQTAAEYNATVTGLDLTPEYKIIATRLSEMVGMSDQTSFITGSALNIPFADNIFDRAYTIHASMNIQDKDRMYKEAYRVLTPGGVFGLYDILAGPQNEDMAFPVPWANTPQTSFLISADETIERLLDVGFKVQKQESREEFALSALRRAYDLQDDDQTTGGNSPPEGITNSFRLKIKNLVKNIEAKCCWPWQIICQKPKNS